MRSNSPVNADARANAALRMGLWARAGHRERWAVEDVAQLPLHISDRISTWVAETSKDGGHVAIREQRRRFLVYAPG